MHLDANRVVEELAAGGFKDRRLAARLRGLAERFVVKPSASFPKALGGSAELEAAYRFFGNVAVTPDAVLAGHFEGVRRRAEREDTVLALHDTSVFTFRHDGQRRLCSRRSASVTRASYTSWIAKPTTTGYSTI